MIRKNVKNTEIKKEKKDPRDATRRARELFFLRRMIKILLINAILLIIYYKSKKMTRRIFWISFIAVIISIFKVDFLPRLPGD